MRRMRLWTSSGLLGMAWSSEWSWRITFLRPMNSEPNSSRNSSRLSKAKRPSPSGSEREEKLRALADAAGELDEIGGDDFFFADGDFKIAQEIFDLEVGDGDAEVAGGNVFELVRFVEDDAGGGGQDSGVGSFFGGEFDREIGEEEMVVDDDDVALGGFAAHGGDEAALELRALAADAVLGAGVELAPERAGLGQGGEFGAVAGAGFLVPVEQGAELVDLIEAVEDGLAGEVVELFAAEIVLAALHVADLEARLGRLVAFAEEGVL